MKNKVRVLFFLLLICNVILCGVTNSANASGTKPKYYPVGMKTYGILSADSFKRIDIAVWYPAATAKNNTTVLDGWNVSAANTTVRPLPGFFPVILLSHDTASSRFANNDTAIALAEAGNIVIAVTHKHDNLHDSDAAYSAELFMERPQHLLWALETVLSSPELAPYVDESRIGLIGVGFGAMTVMQLAGLSPDFSLLTPYCEQQKSFNVFCSSWSGKKMFETSGNIALLKKKHGPNALTPPLSLFAPDLEAALPLLPLKALATADLSIKKDGMFTAIQKWLKNTTSALSKKNTVPDHENTSQEFVYYLDFQGGKRLGGTVLGNVFVAIELSDMPFLRINVPQKKNSLTTDEGNFSEPDLRPHRRSAQTRAIRSVALLAPAGGMLFPAKNSSLLIPGLIVAAEFDELYPYEEHGSFYEPLFSATPIVKEIAETDHFSLFATCSKSLMDSLSEICGNVSVEKRDKLQTEKNTLFVSFFMSTLGGALPQPEASGFVQAILIKKDPLLSNGTELRIKPRKQQHIAQ